MVRIISESSIAAGIRRIEAITGRAVEEMMDKTQDLVNSLRALFNNAPNLTAAIQKAINDNAELKKQVEEFKAQQIVELRKAQSLPVPGAVLPGGQNVGAHGQANEQVAQQIDDGSVGAHRRQRIVSGEAAHHNDVRRVEQKLQNAGEHQRQCKLQQLGERLGITQSVVNKRKARILIKLRKIIEN